MMDELPKDPIMKHKALSEDEEKWIRYMAAETYGQSSHHELSPDILDFILLLVDELKLDKMAMARAYVRYESGDRIDLMKEYESLMEPEEPKE